MNGIKVCELEVLQRIVSGTVTEVPIFQKQIPHLKCRLGSYIHIEILVVCSIDFINDFGKPLLYCLIKIHFVRLW